AVGWLCPDAASGAQGKSLMKTSKRLFVIGVSALELVAIGGCFHRNEPEPTAMSPKVPVQQIVAPALSAPPSPVISGTEVEGTEPYIESLVAVDSDVRLVLQKIAEIGKLDLIISGGIKKK